MADVPNMMTSCPLTAAPTMYWSQSRASCRPVRMISWLGRTHFKIMLMAPCVIAKTRTEGRFNRCDWNESNPIRPFSWTTTLTSIKSAHSKLHETGSAGQFLTEIHSDKFQKLGSYVWKPNTANTIHFAVRKEQNKELKFTVDLLTEINLNHR